MAPRALPPPMRLPRGGGDGDGDGHPQTRGRRVCQAATHTDTPSAPGEHEPSFGGAPGLRPLLNSRGNDRPKRQRRPPARTGASRAPDPSAAAVRSAAVAALLEAPLTPALREAEPRWVLVWG